MTCTSDGIKSLVSRKFNVLDTHVGASPLPSTAPGRGTGAIKLTMRCVDVQAYALQDLIVDPNQFGQPQSVASSSQVRSSTEISSSCVS